MYYYDNKRGILIDKDNTNVRIKIYPPHNGKFKLKDYPYTFILAKEVSNSGDEPTPSPTPSGLTSKGIMLTSSNGDTCKVWITPPEYEPNIIVKKNDGSIDWGERAENGDGDSDFGYLYCFWWDNCYYCKSETPSVGDVVYESKSWSSYDVQPIGVVSEYNGGVEPKSFEYSKDGGNTWMDMDNSDGNGVELPAMIRAKKEQDFIGWFQSTGEFDVAGDIRTLYSPTGSITKPNCYRLFRWSKVNDASNLDLSGIELTTFQDRWDAINEISNIYQMFSNSSITSIPQLPFRKMVKGAYDNLFSYCTKLVDISNLVLPVMELEESCYNEMFSYCKNLKNINHNMLPAQDMKFNCYKNMFCGCSNLTESPNLPAKKLEEGCYYQMFYSCSNLSEIWTSATDVSAKNCLTNWVRSVKSSGTFHKNSSASIPSGNNGIPSGWTVVNDM